MSTQKGYKAQLAESADVSGLEPDDLMVVGVRVPHWAPILARMVELAVTHGSEPCPDKKGWGFESLSEHHFDVLNCIRIEF